jgi:hypothetical protein
MRLSSASATVTAMGQQYSDGITLDRNGRTHTRRLRADTSSQIGPPLRSAARGATTDSRPTRVDRLERLERLHNSGALTDEEFAAETAANGTRD